MRIATDFDGTLQHIIPILRKLRLSKQEIRKKDILVITGQTAKRNDNTRMVLNMMGFRGIELRCFPPYDGRDFGPYTLKKIAEWKADQVKNFNADYYFDDDMRVLMEVQKLNPDVICLLVIG